MNNKQHIALMSIVLSLYLIFTPYEIVTKIYIALLAIVSIIFFYWLRRKTLPSDSKTNTNDKVKDTSNQ